MKINGEKSYQFKRLFDFFLQKQCFVLFVFCQSGPIKIEKTKENVLAGFDIPKSSLFQNIF